MFEAYRSLSKGLTTVCAAVFLVLLVAACGDSGSGPTPDPVVSISISPTNATVGAAETQSLTATVTNATNTGVTWVASNGTIDGSGGTVTWTAPVAAGSYTVTATSLEDPSKSAAATITVTPVAISLSPTAVTLLRSQPTAFAASITGTTASDEVTWEATCGELTPNGGAADYVAPAAGGPCQVTATSVLDPSMSATTTVDVRQAVAVTAGDDNDDGACSWDHCSLREAMNAANTGMGSDTIYLSAAAASSAVAGLSTGSAQAMPAVPTSLQLGSSLPSITESLTVIGEGSGTSVLDLGATQQDMRRGFDVDGTAGNVVFRGEGFTIQNGVHGGGAGAYVRDGGRLETNDVAFLGHTAVEAEGGALVVVGDGSTAVLENTVFDGNQTVSPNWPGGAIGVVGGGSLEMTGGRISNNMTYAWGGGIRGINVGSITLTNTVIEGNQIMEGGFGGAGFYIENPASSAPIVFSGVTVRDNLSVGPGGAGGGALRDNLLVSIDNSTFTGNTAVEGAGLSMGNVTATIQGSSFDNNVSDVRAGGLHLWGSADVTFTGGTVNGNTSATLGGSGFYLQQTSRLEITGTTIQGNVVTDVAGGGFAVFNDATLIGTDLMVKNNSGAGGGAMFYLGSELSSVSFTNSTFEGNTAELGGGGLFSQGSGSLTVTGGAFINNDAQGASGGGIFTMEQVRLQVTGTHFTGNSAHGAGGGLWLRGVESMLDQIYATGNSADINGGAISAGGETTLKNSTLSGNTAADRGGAILSVPTGTMPMLIENVTISGNSAARGGGIGALGDIDLTHTTLFGNTATGEGPGLWVSQVAETPPTVTATNSLFAASALPGGPLNCALDTGAPGLLMSGGGNLSDDASCAPFFMMASDLNSTAPLLNTTLADNGGPTMTHALEAGSPAIGAGVAAGVIADQRGVTRADPPSIGAVEPGGL